MSSPRPHVMSYDLRSLTYDFHDRPKQSLSTFFYLVNTPSCRSLPRHIVNIISLLFIVYSISHPSLQTGVEAAWLCTLHVVTAASKISQCAPDTITPDDACITLPGI